MNFTTFVKIGGHAFNLLQNKDILELYGVVKPGIQNQIKKIKAQPAPPGIPSGAAPPALGPQWMAGSYPIPIDSPYWAGPPTSPYGLPPYARPPYGMPLPPGYPKPIPSPPRRGTPAASR